MENVDDDFPFSIEDNPPSTFASMPVPLNDDDDLDDLTAKACALASIPVPDYTESFARHDRKKDKRQYKIQHYRDEVMRRTANLKDRKSVMLANKTSNILSEFQDYVTEIDNESSLSSGKKILEDDGYLEDVMIGRNYGGSKDKAVGIADGLVAREWNYDGYVNKQNVSLTKNRNLYIGGDDYGDGDNNNHIESAYSSDKDKHLHSKYVKMGITGVIVLVVLLGTTIALSSGKGTDNVHEDPILSDKDLQQQLQEEDDDHAEVTGQDESGGESPEGTMAFITTERDEPNQDTNIVTEAILQDELYGAASAKYALNNFNLPTDWTNTAYDAREFCINKGNYDLCPYDAICPLGPGTMPLGGYTKNAMGENKNGEGATWTPIADRDNEWVQLSRESACIKYSDEHDDSLTWGKDGNKDTVSTIWCCGMLPAEVEEEAEEILAQADLEVYVKVFEEFEPMLHDREDGWEGQTYEDAIQYCSSTEGYEICSYAAICPLGPDHEPVGGYKDNLSDGGSSLWVPISNGPNAWIGVSTDNSCVSYEEKLSRAPEWGITGEHNVDITQTILCCKRSVSGTGEVAFRYEDIAEKHRPNWYDRSEGWVGRTYNEAVAFCLNRAQVLCPYEAYCPMADLDSPLGGVIEDEPNGSWVATSDVPNSWISVGPEDTCKPYDAVNGEVPEWGITGIANEEVTRHVMCCKSLEDDDDVGALGSQEDGDEPNN